MNWHAGEGLEWVWEHPMILLPGLIVAGAVFIWEDHRNTRTSYSRPRKQNDSTLLSLVASPLLRRSGYALLALGIVTGAYVKGRHDDYKYMYAKQQAAIAKAKKEDADAIAAANAARDAALKKFDNGGLSAHPGGLLGRVVTDQTGSPGIDSMEVACKSFNPVYWSHKDTEQTIRQVVGNNAAGLKLSPRFADWARKHGWR